MLWRLAIEIGIEHFQILFVVEPAFDGEIAQVPHGIVHAAIFPIDDPHAGAVIEEVFAEGVAMARHERGRISGQCSADGFSFADHVMVACGQVDSFGGEQFQIVVDHCKEFKAKGKHVA